MTTKRKSASAATLRDRYETLMTDVDVKTGRDLNSALYEGLSYRLRRLAGRMVGGTQRDEEYDALCRLEEHLLATIRLAILDFTSVVENSRAMEREQAAEYIAPYLLDKPKAVSA